MHVRIRKGSMQNVYVLACCMHTVIISHIHTHTHTLKAESFTCIALLHGHCACIQTTHDAHALCTSITLLHAHIRGLFAMLSCRTHTRTLNARSIPMQSWMQRVCICIAPWYGHFACIQTTRDAHALCKSFTLLHAQNFRCMHTFESCLLCYPLAHTHTLNTISICMQSKIT